MTVMTFEQQDPAPTWTILIPTLGQRRQQFIELMSHLMPQVDAAGGQVSVRAYWNNGEPPLAEVRQRLLDSVTTDYVSFFDDDDLPAEDFVPRVLDALATRPDYVGFRVQYFVDGQDRGLIDHSLRHGGWREEKNPYRLLRDISHINPMRTDVAQKVSFRGVRPGGIEDRPWVDRVRKTGLLRTETYIPAPMYHYRWSRKGSAWAKPRKIQRVKHGPAEIRSPNFSYFTEGIREVKREPAPDARLAVVIPSRGRPDNIVKVIEAWDATDAWTVADMVLALDGDDLSLFQYEQVEIDVMLRSDRPRGIYIRQQERWVPMVEKLNRVALQFAENGGAKGKYFAIGFAGDDHLPRTQGWAQTYLAELAALGSGMVFGDDGYQGANLGTEWAVTADVVRVLGRMVPAGVDHLYCDNAMMTLFTAAGAIKHLPQVRIEHMHPVAGKAERDRQYDRVNSSAQFAADRRHYQAWKRTEMAGQVALVRALREHPTAPAAPVLRSPVRATGRTPRPERSRPRMPSRSVFPRHFRNVKGVTPDEIGLTLADLASQVPADQEIVELGVYHGSTLLKMAWGAQQGKGAHVTGIDPWDLDGNVYGDEMGDMNGAHKWAQYWIRSLGYSRHITLIKAFSGVVAASWADDGDGEPGKPVGLLFVDGDHTAEGACRDIESWAPHLAPGAVIAVDDYVNENYPGVAQAVDALVTEGVLERVEIYHDRMAVTRLAVAGSTRTGKDGAGVPAVSPATAITSEGVEPPPVAEANRAVLEAEWEKVDPDGVAALRESAAQLETGQLPESLGQLRALARRRGVPGTSRMGRNDLIEILRALPPEQES